MKQNNILPILFVIVLFIFGTIYFINRTSDTGSSSSPIVNIEEEQAVKKVVTDFAYRLRNVSLLAPIAILSASFDKEYSAFVAPELLAEWKSNPKTALGRETSNPWPESAYIVATSRNADGSYIVEANVIEVTSGTPNETAAVHPVTFKIENRNGVWLISSATKGAYSELPEKVTVTGKQICLPHKDTTGPQTLECAIGFKIDDGENYVLDMNLLSSTDAADLINSGVHVRVQGIITPAVALSSNQWQKYNMKGILSVTSAVRI